MGLFGGCDVNGSSVAVCSEQMHAQLSSGQHVLKVVHQLKKVARVRCCTSQSSRIACIKQRHNIMYSTLRLHWRAGRGALSLACKHYVRAQHLSNVVHETQQALLQCMTGDTVCRVSTTCTLHRRPTLTP